MKVFCIFAIVPMASFSALSNLGLYNAIRNGAMVNICLHIVDTEGNPVSQARLSGGMQTGNGMNDFSPIEGMTNTNGDYIVSGRCSHRLRCGVRKHGYYPSEFSISYPVKDAVPEVVDGKWQPYGERRTIVLKEIRNPGVLCVFPDSPRNYRIPEFGKWIGFDLECSDWVAPYGRGCCYDVLLKFSSMEKGMNHYRYVMDVAFTNNPHAGAYQLMKDKSSKLTTCHAADPNETYKAMFSYISEQSPGMPRHWEYLGRDSYLVFRTRTKVDEHGKLISAHYGKILGRWLLEKDLMILSDGCFNPIENDVNIEDGSGLRNVLRNLYNRR